MKNIIENSNNFSLLKYNCIFFKHSALCFVSIGIQVHSLKFDFNTGMWHLFLSIVKDILEAKCVDLSIKINFQISDFGIPNCSLLMH